MIALALASLLLVQGPGRMASIPAGAYRPLYAVSGATVRVAAFRIDVDPVTRGSSPMTNVSWTEAQAYCRAQGKRLPTLAEWEYVAAASAKDAIGDAAFLERLISVYSTRSATPRPVSAGELNAYGVRGMHDLVWEWVADPNERITNAHCAGAALGASDPRNYAAFLRNAVRAGLERDTRLATLGFRCAQ